LSTEQRNFYAPKFRVLHKDNEELQGKIDEVKKHIEELKKDIDA
jgi:peptidoglycan hydrolase CwlO-like protein